MRIILDAKKMVTDEVTCNVFTEMNGVGSVTFLADLPRNAIVVDVLVNGKSIENYSLAEYRNNGNTDKIYYPRNEMFEGKTVAAVYVDETCGGKLYNLAFSGGIKKVVVKYINTAIAEV